MSALVDLSIYTAENAKAEKTSVLLLYIAYPNYVESIIVGQRELGRLGMSSEVLEIRVRKVVDLCSAEIDVRIPPRAP